MSKYTAEQVEAAADCLPDAYEDQAAKLRDYAALLRERESAKAAVTEKIALRLGLALADSANKYGYFTHPKGLQEALEAVAPMLASAPVPDGWNDAIHEARKRIHAMALNNGWDTSSDAYAVSCLLEDMLAAATKPETEG